MNVQDLWLLKIDQHRQLHARGAFAVQGVLADGTAQAVLYAQGQIILALLGQLQWQLIRGGMAAAELTAHHNIALHAISGHQCQGIARDIGTGAVGGNGTDGETRIRRGQQQLATGQLTARHRQSHGCLGDINRQLPVDYRTGIVRHLNLHPEALRATQLG
ncbi:hypothetical protein CAG70_05840, partial [Photobacterium halotolerans]|uniref:hypothetical protein n=1 Tax=Photobacterium halotolerans TaxID=265726 RepID=UPI0013734C54